MNMTIALFAVALSVQTGTPTLQHGTPTQTHPQAQDSITEGLPAQVVADLARRALSTPDDEQNWAELTSLAGTSRPASDVASDVSGFAHSAYGFAHSAWDSVATWVSRSAESNPKTWIGILALFTALLVGLRSGQDTRHVARARSARPARSIVWNVRSRSWPSPRRRVGVPRADYLLGRGLPAREVALQTRLSRDLVGLVDFCSAGRDDGALDDVVLHTASTGDQQGGSSAAGSIARSEDRPPEERASSHVSVIA